LLLLNVKSFEKFFVCLSWINFNPTLKLRVGQLWSWTKLIYCEICKKQRRFLVAKVNWRLIGKTSGKSQIKAKMHVPSTSSKFKLRRSSVILLSPHPNPLSPSVLQTSTQFNSTTLFCPTFWRQIKQIAYTPPSCYELARPCDFMKSNELPHATCHLPQQRRQAALQAMANRWQCQLAW